MHYCLRRKMKWHNVRYVACDSLEQPLLLLPRLRVFPVGDN